MTSPIGAAWPAAPRPAALNGLLAYQIRILHPVPTTPIPCRLAEPLVELSDPGG
jgi:hypothetical protein